MIKKTIVALIALLFVGVGYPALAQSKAVQFFAGQDLGAVGGFDDHNEGYVDYFGVPEGVTVYTSLSELEGFSPLVNFGAGDVETNRYLESEKFSGVDIAMGLYLVDQLPRINKGELDKNIVRLANWIKASNRTIYLRVGYEFEGEWNGYNPGAYKKAFKRIVDLIKQQEVENVQFVWQSSGYEEKRDNLLNYYPGDEYVDWLGYSYFNHEPDMAGVEIRKLAREKNKPVFIAELTPRGHDLMLDDGEKVWESWFVPFFAHLEKNKDVIGAVAYINARWDDQPMWKGQGWGDSRLQANEYIASNWRKQLQKASWQHGKIEQNPPVFTQPESFAQLQAERQQTLKASTLNKNQWQAEDAKPSGNARIYPDGHAAGGKGMAYIYAIGDSVTFEGVPQSNYMEIRYASEMTGTLGLFVNNQRVKDIKFKSTGSWVGAYKKVTMRVNIPDGSDVSIGWETGDKAMNIDYVTFDRR